jgi:hypothetical protein
MRACEITPLCPAGHLPLKGGDRTAARLSPISNAADGYVLENNIALAGNGEGLTLPISPLEGEMSGRTEGGNRR